MPGLGLFRVLAAIEICSDDDRAPAGRKGDCDIVALVGRALRASGSSLVPHSPVAGQAGTEPIGASVRVPHPLQEAFPRRSLANIGRLYGWIPDRRSSQRGWGRVLFGSVPNWAGRKFKSLSPRRPSSSQEMLGTIEHTRKLKRHAPSISPAPPRRAAPPMRISGTHDPAESYGVTAKALKLAQAVTGSQKHRDFRGNPRAHSPGAGAGSTYRIYRGIRITVRQVT
jgi:hypothetical protein